MKTSIDNNKYDTMLEPSDWRFSAAIVGLMKYLSYHNFDYEVDDDYILYNSEDITEDKYLEFVEYKYGNELHHKVVENILVNEEISDEQQKIVNDKLNSNTIMKNKFKGIKFDKSNKDEILNVIQNNRYEIIKETFRSKSNMYANYANTNQLFNESQDFCRLAGYCIDASKKGKSTGYNFAMSSFVGHDEKEFDFIPFAFEGNREAYFINDNYTIKRLKVSNDMLSKKIQIDLDNDNKYSDARQALFKGIIESSDFISRDVEVIFKDRDKGYFENLYLRKESIDIFKKLKDEGIDYKTFCFSQKITDKYYLNVQKEVTDSILNNILLDNLIELFLKKKRDFLVAQLIKINGLIRGDKDMKQKLKGAFACAKQVAKVIENNKIDSYRQKLTSSIIFKDYDRVCQILLQLSNYSGIEFGFVYDLFDDFEDNKDLAYTFINALSKNTDKNTDNNSANN
ncbi:type I CRISPR-associated protein Cas8a1/Csx8 [Clostridium butyricum]|jgi:CRISPR-associated protein Cst1|uniref:Type I CRISPR-associated protein Cas8a1/Csx8 n=1 Tax=Clostridium butyricum TaxID=1492 RepID=A0A512TNP0_CLOBU|nr:type I CRISPR-associated protein Cas8a1/Csx8 [Clostridium butyricum]NOW25214.1 CRISPR-associated protein Cst1 [Clostridium butyricum]RQN09188.1 type I CRISPR-associated protein Cas8a1/Csx8 [Clostridium butyricum]GEQ21837.1 type I CRISPR-associated protein Cas8a1/Csx8 [Clostridium butyricum]